MNTLPNHPLLEVTPDDVKTIRKLYDVDDEKTIEESLQAVEEWCKKQDHLQEALKFISRNMLERLFILARGSVENTKLKIDKFLTMRGMASELTLKRCFDEFEIIWENSMFVPLPKLSPIDRSRVIVSKSFPGKWDVVSLITLLRYTYLVMDYRLLYDYMVGDRYILDFKGITLNVVGKMNPITLKRSEILATEGYGSRIKGIHIVNAPAFIDKIIFIFKQALKEKVASRLHVHNSYSELHKHIPKEILPKEYGGDAPSTDDLQNKWRECLKLEEKVIEDFNKLVADESKRSDVKFNEEYLGIPGSFRKLVVD